MDIQLARVKAALFYTAIALLLVVSLPRPAAADEETALWNALRSGTAFAIMRHALAPGTGDPQEVIIGDCSTQRNLSDRGRDQSRRIGERFRANGIPAARVYTSAWCRCAETAELLKIGPVSILSSLNSFYTEPDRSDAQTEALRAWLANAKPGHPFVLVTHQVNITALTDIYPRSGEFVVARLDANGNIRVLGRIHLPA